MTGILPVPNFRYLSKMQKTMKKTIVLSAVAVAAALVSCNKEQDNLVPEKPQGIPFEITAGTVDTKTANDDVHTTWVAGDKINLFHAENNTDSYVSDGTFTAAADGASVAFSGTLGEALDGEKNYDWYALYPYENDYANTPASFDYVYIADRDNSYTQTQVGNDSKAHLAGNGYPLWGKKTNVAAATKPSIDLNQMTAVIAVNVTNKIEDDITVSKVEFWTSAETHLVGEYRANFAGASPVLTNSSGQAIATLNVSGASALAKNASGVYYFAVKPFDAPAGSSLSIRVTTDEGVQTSENIVPLNYSFTAGKIYTLNFNFTNKTVNLAQFPYNDPTWLTAQSINPGESSSKDLNGAAQTVTPITITSTDGGTKTRIFKTGTPATYDLRVYKNGGSLTVATTSSSYVIEKITFAGSGLSAANLSADSGTYAEGTTTWTGLAQDVKFTATENWNIKNIGVFYRTATASDHILIVPVRAFDAAYTAGSVGITIKQLNIADLVVDSSSAGYVDYSVAGNTITVNLSANGSTSPRNIVVSVSSVSAGVDETVTITQAGAPATISSLTTGSGKTAKGKVAAVSKKGLILADNTAAIFVYSDTDETGRTIGDIVQVSGSVAEYNTGLQFAKSGLSIEDAPGSITYSTTPTVYDKAAINAFLANEHNEFADLIQFTGVVKKDGSYYNIIVGGGDTPNVTLYSPLSSLLTGVADGDNVTITGYAYNITSGKCCVIPTIVTNNETTPKIVYSDITGVSAAGVTNQNVSGSAFRISGWTPNVTFTGCVTAASINAACTQITYTVGENTGSTERNGTIVVTFTKSGESDVPYTINVSQNAPLAIANLDFTFNAGTIAANTAITDITLPTGMSYDTSIAATNYKCYANYVGMRADKCAYIVHFDVAAASIDFTGRRQGSGDSTNSMTVSGSTDGITYTAIETISITETSDTKKTVSNDINSSYRYIKFTFNKQNGNYSLKQINIKK